MIKLPQRIYYRHRRKEELECGRMSNSKATESWQGRIKCTERDESDKQTVGKQAWDEFHDTGSHRLCATISLRVGSSPGHALI